MLKKLIAALFRRGKKTMPEPARTEPRLPDRQASRPAPSAEQRLQQPRTKPVRLPEPDGELRMLQPRATPKASRSVSPSQASRPDDSLTNPAHPLSPLNPIHDESFNRRADAWIDSRCDDSHRSSSSSSDSYSSSSCSSSSSDSGSSCSSSCD